jgi:hypothetical protein
LEKKKFNFLKIKYSLSKILPTKSPKNKQNKIKLIKLTAMGNQWEINLEVSFVFLSDDFFVSKDEFSQGNQKIKSPNKTSKQTVIQLRIYRSKKSEIENIGVWREESCSDTMSLGFRQQL